MYFGTETQSVEDLRARTYGGERTLGFELAQEGLDDRFFER